MNYDISLVVTITVTCYSWAPSSGDLFFTCGVIFRPPHLSVSFGLVIIVQHSDTRFRGSFCMMSCSHA